MWKCWRIFHTISRTIQIYRGDISYRCEFCGEFKILGVETERGVYTTSEQRELLYTLYIAWRVPARRSRKAARKCKGGQERRCAAAGLTATSGGIRYVYIRHRHAPLPILDVLSCVFSRCSSSFFSFVVSKFLFFFFDLRVSAFPLIRLNLSLISRLTLNATERKDTLLKSLHD